MHGDLGFFNFILVSLVFAFGRILGSLTFLKFLFSQGLMHLQGKPVCSFDPEGLIFAAGVNSEMVKLYDLRSFDKVNL